MDEWSPLTTVINLTSTLEFTETNAANESRRFYRMVLRQLGAGQRLYNGMSA